MPRLEVRRDAKLRKLGTLGPMVGATLCRRMVTCGNSRCRCASGDKHESWCLTYKVQGRTKTVHVPRDMVEDVRGWVQEHKKAKRLMAEISALGFEIIKRHVTVKRAGERERRRAETRSGK